MFERIAPGNIPSHFQKVTVVSGYLLCALVSHHDRLVQVELELGAHSATGMLDKYKI